MAIWRVFVIWTHPLFHESVRLLLNHPDIEWVGETSDYATAQANIERLRPNTLLVEEVGNAVSSDILKILETSAERLRIVCLNLNDNQIKTYQRVQQTVGKVSDLLHLILNDEPHGE